RLAADELGVVMVLHDVTELRRLEQVRTEFVANVSHELRTPLTAVHGYLETLLAGALEERENARRFLEIVFRHTERLGRLLDDLTDLCDTLPSSMLERSVRAPRPPPRRPDRPLQHRARQGVAEARPDAARRGRRVGAGDHPPKGRERPRDPR